ncbi:MAG: toxin-antitoxin system HicB family antitoxin [Acidobacteria bacterium]|nr:toxin-antitoxin system HicB family antitoxin [Acidobacteriota bacterium]
MSSLSLRLPDSLHEKVRELAEQDDVSINQFIATAVAEKAAALLTVSYLEERARRADPRAFDRVLTRVPDVAPGAGDETSPDPRQSDKSLQPTSRRRSRAKTRKAGRAARG